ncbi:MAG: hypothetical protein ACK5XN_36675, partial [Bacteroidota bacterium]
MFIIFCSSLTFETTPELTFAKYSTSQNETFLTEIIAIFIVLFLLVSVYCFYKAKKSKNKVVKFSYLFLLTSNVVFIILSIIFYNLITIFLCLSINCFLLIIYEICFAQSQYKKSFMTTKALLISTIFLVYNLLIYLIYYVQKGFSVGEVIMENKTDNISSVLNLIQSEIDQSTAVFYNNLTIILNSAQAYYKESIQNVSIIEMIDYIFNLSVVIFGENGYKTQMQEKESEILGENTTQISLIPENIIDETDKEIFLDNISSFSSEKVSFLIEYFYNELIFNNLLHQNLYLGIQTLKDLLIYKIPNYRNLPDMTTKYEQNILYERPLVKISDQEIKIDNNITYISYNQSSDFLKINKNTTLNDFKRMFNLSNFTQLSIVNNFSVNFLNLYFINNTKVNLYNSLGTNYN